MPKVPAFSYFHHPKLDKPYPFAKIITQAAFDDALSYKALPEDVFVASYPKCGSTWVLYSLFMLRNGGKPLEKDEILGEEIPFLEMGSKARAEEPQEDMRIMKSHLYSDLMPWNQKTKYIFVARHPKDCFVSYFHHTVGFQVYDYADGNFDEYFELVINGRVTCGDYFKCVGEWYQKAKTNNNILFLLYEDLKSDAKREILKIADFLGPEWGQKMRANGNELLEKIVDETSFNKMTKMKNLFPEYYGWTKHLPFIRKGVIGDWKSLFSEEQSKRVDERLKNAGKEYPGFDHLWDEYSDLRTY